MTNKKITATVFILLVLSIFLVYLSFDFKFNTDPFLSNEKVQQLFFNVSKNSFYDFSKLWSNLKKSNNSKNSSEEFSKLEREQNDKKKSSNSEDRSFEDKCLLTSHSTKSKKLKKSPNFEFLKTEEGKKYKKILAYHHAYTKDFYFGFGHEVFESSCCKEKRCFMTDNRKEIPLEEFDAVLIHFRDFKKKNLPKKRKNHQRYVFYEREPPPYSSKNPEDYKDVFNWTMTYRTDSDIVSGYGKVYKKSDIGFEDYSRFKISLDSAMKTKNKMVAWFVSNCKTPSERSRYTNELKKFIPVDIYGKCGPLKCSAKKSVECFKKVEKEYKFYLSFENNICKDYVTEKFYRTLSFYVIPVVRGGADYAAIAPPHSYINVDDFESPEDLANYLIYLHKNDTAYMEYFNWKKDYFLLSSHHAASFCTLCQKLHSDKTEKVYNNLTKWFLEEAQCNKDLRIYNTLYSA